MWEYWLGKTKKTAASSTLELIGKIVFALGARLFKRKANIMTEGQAPVAAEPAAQPDKTIVLGDVGKIEIDFSHGKALVQLSAAVPGGVGIEGGAFVKCDAEQLINALFAAIEKKLPDSMDPIAEGVKVIVVQAVKAIP